MTNPSTESPAIGPTTSSSAAAEPSARRWVGARTWDNLPLRAKGLIVMGIPMVPLLGIALVSMTMQGIQRRAEAQVTHTHDVKEAVSAALISLLDAETSARGFVLTANQTWLEPYERVRRELPLRLSRIQALVSDNALATARVERIRTLAEARLSAITSLIPYASPAYPPESLLFEGHRRMEALRLEVTAMEAYENGLLAERKARLDVVRRRTRTLIGAAAGSGIAGGLCGVWLVAGGVARRVERVKDNAARLAHSQPLLGTASVDEDEVGHLDRGLRDASILLDQRVQDLNVAREELDRFFGLSLDMLCIAGIDGRFQRLNPAWQETLGWTTEDLTSTRYLDFVHDEDQAATLHEAAKLAGGGVVISFANRYRCKDGSYRWLSWKAAAQPERGRVYAAARDITEEKRTARALQEQATELAAARLQAERANRAKTDFLAHMSHDLRTPLNAILGFAQLLERDDLRPDQHDSVRQIMSGGRHLLELISEVIDITRIESGQLSLSPEAVLVVDVVQRAVELVQPLAIQRGLTLTVEPAPLTAAVLADRQRVHQILLNFLSNAVKYNRPHGTITVTFERVQPGRCRLAVRDTGPGVTAEKLTLLFQPFERLGAEQTSVEGTGLGLALSRTLAEAMNGTVGVHSVVDMGTTFWVELPATETPVPYAVTTPRPTTAVPSRQAQSGVVLYIEDNQANTRLMERILGQRPHVNFLTATDGHTGLAVVRERRPNLIFLDLHLPDMTGEDVLWQLWQDPATRDIPSVVLTADVTPGLAGG